MQTHTIGASGCFLSVRSSCDRCRGQKLKCSVPSGSNTCERCARAKLVCVFGRRTPSRRLRQGSGARDKTSYEPTANRHGEGDTVSVCSESTVPQHTQDASFSGATSALVRDFAPWTSSRTPYLDDTAAYIPPADRHPQVSSFSDVLSPISEQDLSQLMVSSSSYDTQSWTAVQLPASGDQNPINKANYGWSKHDFDTFEPSLLDDELNLHCQQELDCHTRESSGSQSPIIGWLSPESSYTATSIMAETVGAHKAVFDSTPVTPVPILQRLLVLVSEMQDWLAKIEQSPWGANGQDTTNNLDDYPVGAILQFSQQLTDIGRMVLDTENSATADAFEYFGFAAVARSSLASAAKVTTPSSVGRPAGSPSGAPSQDTPTLLLLLSSYMSLVRIYNITLGHFHTHLTRMPMPNRRTPRGPHTVAAITATNSLFGAAAGRVASPQEGPAGRRALRLGELHSAAEAAAAAAAAASAANNNTSSMGGLQRMHLAVSMLLEGLQDVETYLGPGGRLARERAMSLLVKDGQPQDSREISGRAANDTDSPGDRVMAVKRLLREKMGL
ncbi:hypothetical protein BD289DRAFT_453495 [Coniella lustricola]|uniref:Zn(2)-C6 fungal-type domain-containing protein n=1 Tax=Coniella lustricola TaxID=2025994 RepID=A0A2T3A754_9PEZI|nr:hypothetical protein BD289DRAFT_453495 [Coniella lustricola]